jgi:outer membrane protein OmpA-like peptidoglycan-associated protein
VRRLQFLAIVIFLTTACGSSQPAEPIARAEPSAETSGHEEARDGSGDSGDSGDSGEFQIKASDTAREARGERPSEIEATRTEAAMRLFVVAPEEGPIQGVVIKLTAPDGEAYYTDETDSQGYGEVLVPVGQKYQIEYLSLGRQTISASVDVPDKPKQNIRLTLRYHREPGQGRGAGASQRVVLDGVLFETAKATIKGESFPRLDRVVEYMMHRSSARIRVAGHTDNLGNPKKNQTLSEARAKSVRDYLMARGIDGSRIEAVGYGDQQPVASNDTEEGRQQNRRIEAIEL